MQQRQILETIRGTPTSDGAGVQLVRVLGNETAQRFDPFLLLDFFGSDDPNNYQAGFPFHPHRGIEAITYLLEGKVEHQDSLGNTSTIYGGECQWVTAGSGIMHQEMPQADKGPRMLGLQLWLNLPEKDKMTSPHYRYLTNDQVATLQDGPATIRVIGGSYQNSRGLQPEYTDMNLLDITLQPGQPYRLATDPQHAVFLYLVEGALELGQHSVSEQTAVRFGPGDHILLQAGQSTARLIAASGRPLGEPIAWAGPIVMNTRQQLNQAFEQLEQGSFLQQKAE